MRTKKILWCISQRLLRIRSWYNFWSTRAVWTSTIKTGMGRHRCTSAVGRWLIWTWPGTWFWMGLPRTWRTRWVIRPRALRGGADTMTWRFCCPRPTNRHVQVNNLEPAWVQIVLVSTSPVPNTVMVTSRLWWPGDRQLRQTKFWSRQELARVTALACAVHGLILTKVVASHLREDPYNNSSFEFKYAKFDQGNLT